MSSSFTTFRVEFGTGEWRSLLKYLHWLRAISSPLEAKGDGTGELKARQGSFPDVLPLKRIEQFVFVLASTHFSNVMMRRSILW